MEKDNQFFTTEMATAYWLHSMGIENYTIHDDLTVDVNGSVILINENLNYIPVQFGIVKGSFFCYKNNLTSLEGCPKKIGNDFWCYNNPITDFNYLNFEVAGDIYFTPVENMDYLDNYKYRDSGDIYINFIEFKSLLALKQLSEKLNNDLSVKSVKIKHKI